MGAVEDLRKLLQDLVTPDLKSIEARVVALEQKIDLKTDALEKMIVGLDEKIDLKIDALDKKTDLKIDALDKKIDLNTATIMAEIRALAAVVAANQMNLMHSLDIDRRLERIEAERAAARSNAA